MYPDSKKQNTLVRMIGHSCRIRPKLAHNAKPTTVTAYIRVDIAAVSPVFTTLITCGTKLETEHREAKYPTINAVSMSSFIVDAWRMQSLTTARRCGSGRVIKRCLLGVMKSRIGSEKNIDKS